MRTWAIAVPESRREVATGQFVQDPTEHVETCGADFVAQFEFEVDDPCGELSENAVTLGGATHHGGSAIVRVPMHGDESEFPEFADLGQSC